MADPIGHRAENAGNRICPSRYDNKSTQHETDLALHAPAGGRWLDL